MPYCPICETEYRKGINRCSDCDSELVEALPDDRPSPVDTEGVELAELASFQTAAEADMIKELLEGNGIRTIVRGETDPIGATSMAAPATLLVEERDLDRARDLYDAFYAGRDVETEAEPSESQ
jgi:hypothetical protein